jgi:hypothetical protein
VIFQIYGDKIIIIIIFFFFTEIKLLDFGVLLNRFIFISLFYLYHMMCNYMFKKKSDAIKCCIFFLKVKILNSSIQINGVLYPTLITLVTELN